MFSSTLRCLNNKLCFESKLSIAEIRSSHEFRTAKKLLVDSYNIITVHTLTSTNSAVPLSQEIRADMTSYLPSTI